MDVIYRLASIAAWCMLCCAFICSTVRGVLHHLAVLLIQLVHEGEADQCVCGLEGVVVTKDGRAGNAIVLYTCGLSAQTSHAN